MGTETELKLSIDPKAVEQFYQHPLIQSVSDSEKTIQMRGIYYDTPEHQLRQHKTSLRVRLENDSWVQTVKTIKKTESGLHQRGEWETDVPSDSVVFDKLPKSAKKSVFSDPQLWERLQPLFETRFERHTWQLIDADDNHIEICLDQGMVKTVMHSEPISEVELELKAGDPLSLYRIALLLQKTLPLRSENTSKAARGYQLHQTRIPKAERLSLPQFSQNIHIAEAFETSCSHAIAQIQANEAVIKYHNDHDGAKALQQGILKLQATLFLYHDLLAPKFRQKFKHQARKAQRLVERVLKWEQLLRDSKKMTKVAPGQADLLQRLQTAISTQRRQSYIKLRRYLHSVNYSRFLLRVSYWLLQQPIVSHEQGSAQLFATENLAKHYRHVLAMSAGCKQDRHAERLSMNLLIVDSLQPLPRYQRLQKQINSQIHDRARRCQVKQMRRCLDELGIDSNAQVYYFVLGWYAAKI